MDEPSVRPRRILEAICAASLLCVLSIVLVDRPQPVARGYSVSGRPLQPVALRSRIVTTPAPSTR